MHQSIRLAVALSREPPDATYGPSPHRGTPLRDIGAQKRLRGLTVGEAAERQVRQAREHREQCVRQAQNERLEDITGLRETLTESTTYGHAWACKARLFRAIREITALRGSRLSKCMTFRVHGAQIEVHTAPDGRAKYTGVAVCGSGWSCPHCAPRISERHRLELRAAADYHRLGGGALLLCAFTFSHGMYTDLRESWGRLGNARQRFARHKDVKRFRKRSGWIGRVQAREITFGINGWHPHAHSLEFINDTSTGAAPITELDLEEWLPVMQRAWQDCCKASGLECSIEHGFDMSLTEADDYIAKWGADAELTKWHTKRGRGSTDDAPDERGLWGYTPFDLLRIFDGQLAADPRLNLTRERAAALFAEFVSVSKGSAQLHWSRGLKDRLVVDEKADAEEPVYEHKATLELHEWRVIQDMGVQLEFLGLAAHSWQAARAALDRWIERANIRARRALERPGRGPPSG